MKIRHSSRLYVYLASKLQARARAHSNTHRQTHTRTHATYRALRLARFHVFGFMPLLCAHQPPALSSIQLFRNLLLRTRSLFLSLHCTTVLLLQCSYRQLLQVTVISVVIIIMYSFVENSSQTENLFAYRVRAIKTNRRRKKTQSTSTSRMNKNT